MGCKPSKNVNKEAEAEEDLVKNEHYKAGYRAGYRDAKGNKSPAIPLDESKDIEEDKKEKLKIENAPAAPELPQARANRYVTSVEHTFYTLKDEKLINETLTQQTGNEGFSIFYPIGSRGENLRKMLTDSKLQTILKKAKEDTSISEKLRKDVEERIEELKETLTLRTVLKSYTDDGLYVMLNKYTRLGTHETLNIFSEYLCLLKGSLLDLGEPLMIKEKEKLTLYRGLSLKKDQLKYWEDAGNSSSKEDKYGLFPAFTSTSRDEKTALKFIETQKEAKSGKAEYQLVEIIIHLVEDNSEFCDFLQKFKLVEYCGIFYPPDIHKYSAFEEEKEVLFPPFYPFKIESVATKPESEIVCVHLNAPNQICMSNFRNYKEKLSILKATREWSNEYIEKMCELARNGLTNDLSFCKKRVVELAKVDTVKEALENAKRITKFSLDFEKLTMEDLKRITDVLITKHAKYLTSLSLEYCYMGPEAVEIICAVLPKLEKLTSFFFSGNIIGEEGMKALFPVLQQMKTLSKIDLRENLVGIETIEELKLELAQEKGKEVDLSVNSLRLEDLEEYTREELVEKEFPSAIIRRILKSDISSEKFDFNQINCTFLDYEILSSFSESMPSLKEVDLSESITDGENIKGLWGLLERSESLTTLNLAGNQIEACWVSELKESLEENDVLLSFNFSNNPLGGEGAKTLAEVLKTNKTLTTLKLNNTNIGDVGVKHLAEALVENHKLTTLELDYNEIGSQGAEYIKNALINNNTLTSLHIRNNNIDDKGAKELADALLQNHTLISLELSLNNKLGKKGVKVIAKALMQNDTLTTLGLRGIKFGMEGAKEIANVLLQNRKLTELDLSWAKIDAEGARYIANVLLHNNTLTKLKLGSNNIQIGGAKELSSALLQNHTLTSLGLKHNKIGAEGAKYVASALTKNHTLIELNVSENDIKDEGAKKFAKVLMVNSTLATLNIRSNKIGVEGMKALESALLQNRTLATLNIGENHVGRKGMNSLAAILSHNSTLTNLQLESSGFHAEETKELAKALEQNCTITTLALGYNEIDNEGSKALANALVRNHTLTELDLYQCEIEDEDARILKRALAQNVTLKKLVLDKTRLSETVVEDLESDSRVKIWKNPKH